MALVLPHSIFFHVGRTAGHSVRKTVREMGMPTYDVGAFHDWPSNISLIEEEKQKLFFCFVRHPLTWLKSFWCHETQFGWSECEYTTQVQSDAFAEFLEKAVAAYPCGPVMEIFRPFITQCQEVGRQENLEADLARILERAGERLVPGLLDKRTVTTVSVDRRIAESATAPQALLEKVLKSEREICERFRYVDIPQGMVGPSQVCLAPYVQLGISKHAFTVDDPAVRGVRNAFVLNGDRFRGASSPRVTMAIRDALEASNLQGRDVIDVSCEDGLFCFFAEAKEAASVVGVTRNIWSVTTHLKSALDSNVSFLKHGCYGVEQVIDQKFDIALCWARLHNSRHPMLLIRSLSRLMKEGGTLVLSTHCIDAFPGIPLMYTPLGSETPFNAEGCSYFNKEGLMNALASYGFHDFKFRVELETGTYKDRDFGRMPFAKDRVFHDSESAIQIVVMTCTWSPAAADSDPRYALDHTIGQGLSAWWDSELPSSGLPESVANNDMLVMLYSQWHTQRDVGQRLQRELHAMAAAVKDREEIVEDTRRDLVARTEELDETREELVGRTAELDAARHDLIARTQELDQIRLDLVDRTRRLEKTEEAVRQLTAEVAESTRSR